MATEPAFFVRRADPDDIDTLNALYDRIYPEDAVVLESLAYFHAVDRGVLRKADQRTKFLLSLIETSFIAVTVEDEESHVVGFAVLDDTPLQLSATEDAGTDWESWFQDTFELPGIDSSNSLWFSTCLIDGDPNIMGEILRTTFSTMPELRSVLTFVPATITEDGAMKILQPFQSHFAQLDMMSDELMAMTHWAAPSLEGHPPMVLSCNRSQVIAPLGIRIARVEDHDNLAAVFDAQSEVVTSVYGDFFIAELIEAQNDENRALVAEVDGRAVGLMCLTSDVDINVLAQCFQVDPYDNLLKGPYMKRVREHSRRLMEGQDASLCAPGDFLQVALGSMDMDALLDSIPKLEDGRINAVQLHGALQMQEFSDEVGEVLQEFEKSIMMLFWQANFLEPMLQENSLLFPSKVSECVQLFMNLDITERKAIASEVLERWAEVQDILKLTKEAMAGPGDVETEEKEDKYEENLGDLLEADTTVDTVVFFKALGQEEQGPFTQDFLAKLLITLHWWGDVDISSPLALLPEDGYREALEKVMQSEEGLFVSHPNSPSWLANMPPHSKDVFCVNMFCLDQAFQTQALDFLLPAFSLFPEKDYCIITQPHTAPNTPLLNAFTIVPPQPQNTFGHVLYLIHRASLLGPPKVVSLKPHLLEQVHPLLEVFEEETRQEIISQSKLFLQERKASELEVFVVDFDSQVVGLIMLQMPNADVVDRLRCCYHLDDYLLVEHHETGGFSNKGHVRLLHWVLNPLFQKYTRRLLQGALRICGKTALFLETELKESVSSIYRELLQVAPRRPPQLKKILREPPKVASFCNIEEELPTEEDLREKERQQLLRNLEQTKALSIVAKKLLSETKIPVNARIVVVGASDCGLSFLESLLSIPHLLFNSLTLLAPGGLEYHHAHHLPLVAGTAAYSHQELRRIMLELRVRILDSRMVHIDRQQKCCILHDGSMLPYDYLVVATGLQDDALHALKIQSMGVEHVTDGYRRVNGAMSAADPSIRDLLVEGGTLVKSLIWNPLSYAVVYGRSLNAYCVVQGLLLRKVPAKKIILVLPSRSQESQQGDISVNAFYEGDEVEKKIHHILETMGLKVYEGYRLLGIQQCTRGRLKGLIFEDHNGGEVVPLPAEETAEREREKRFPAPEAARAPMGILEDFGASPANLPQKLLACRICITADAVNVDPDIFNSVHGNGLVYDGRLIVDHSFGTTDPAIYGAGSLCEFSRRFQRQNSRYLRHDGFNGREVGAKLAGALLKRLDPVNGDSVAAGGVGMTTTQDLPTASMMTATEEESSPDLLPEFYMPIAKGGLLPGSLHYYRIHACRRGDMQEEPSIKEEQVIVTDTLDLANGTGHFCRLTLDAFGKVDSITYLGGEALQVESLWSLVGLSETFLNYLYQRWRDNDIPDIVEFLADEWATALFHDRFMDFCHQIKLEMLASEEVKDLINKALEGVNLKEGLSRKLLTDIRKDLPSESVKQIQDHLLDYLQENTNHLKTYFLSWQWAEQGARK